MQKFGPVRDLNPGPLAPKARIIPLDQRAIHMRPIQSIDSKPAERCGLQMTHHRNQIRLSAFLIILIIL